MPPMSVTCCCDFHQRDDRVVALRRKLARVTVVKANHVARELDDRGLHSEADAEERQPGLARVADRLEHSFDSANSESARNENAVKVGEQLAGLLPAR